MRKIKLATIAILLSSCIGSDPVKPPVWGDLVDEVIYSFCSYHVRCESIGRATFEECVDFNTEFLCDYHDCTLEVPIDVADLAVACAAEYDEQVCNSDFPDPCQSLLIVVKP